MNLNAKLAFKKAKYRMPKVIRHYTNFTYCFSSNVKKLDQMITFLNAPCTPRA